jgi:phospholipase A1
MPESSHSDDNPGISDYIGRGELSALLERGQATTPWAPRCATRCARRAAARRGWNGCSTLGTGLGGGKSNLRLHTQLFSGYGDSLIDYNRKRTVFSVGLSLVDW